jgi:hypothetical protein
MDDDIYYRKISGMDQSEVMDGYVIYDKTRDRVHFLNPAGAIVFELCDGHLTPLQIAEFIEEAFALSERPIIAVRDCLASLLAEGLIETCDRS